MTRFKKRYKKMTSDSDNTLPPDPPERYIIDQITLDEMSSVFTWAQMVIDAQMEQDAADEMQDIMNSLADRFGMDYYDTKTEVEELDSEDGTRTYKIKVDLQKTPAKPALVWTNDQPNKKGLKLIDKDYTDPEASNDDDDPEPPRRA
tara:strand:+ start:562 stop:1002 length:441 start_codon:yes stop_codon:yes gene_type:complete